MPVSSTWRRDRACATPALPRPAPGKNKRKNHKKSADHQMGVGVCHREEKPRARSRSTHGYRFALFFSPSRCGGSTIWRVPCFALARLLSLSFSTKTLSFLILFFHWPMRRGIFLGSRVHVFLPFPFSLQQPPRSRPGPVARVFALPPPPPSQLRRPRSLFFPLLP